MANLIITVIAIALVAVASLMGAYYGGSAFLNNQSAADASSILNESQQLAGAWQSYLATNFNTAPTDAGQLVSTNYIANWPQWPQNAGAAAGGFIILTTGGHYWAIADIGASSTQTSPDTNFTGCARVIKTATNGSPTGAVAVTTLGALTAGNNTNIGSTTFGCALNNITAPANPPTAGTGIVSNSTTGGNINWPTPGTLGTGHYIVYYLLS